MGGFASLADCAFRQQLDQTGYIGAAKIKGIRDVVYQATWMHRVPRQVSPAP